MLICLLCFKLFFLCSYLLCLFIAISLRVLSFICLYLYLLTFFIFSFVGRPARTSCCIVEASLVWMNISLPIPFSNAGMALRGFTYLVFLPKTTVHLARFLTRGEQVHFCTLYRGEKYSFAGSTGTKNTVLLVLHWIFFFIFLSLVCVFFPFCTVVFGNYVKPCLAHGFDVILPHRRLLCKLLRFLLPHRGCFGDGLVGCSPAFAHDYKTKVNSCLEIR